MDISAIFNHKHIVLAGDHYNPLGIIRSLGEEGIKPIVVLCAPHPVMVQHSKYIGELHTFKTNEEGLQFIIENYSNETLKPFIYNGSDETTLLLDKHYDELKDHFYFTNGQGGLDKYLQKYDMCLVASACGIKVPKEELLTVGQMPTTLRYPVITKAATSAAGAWKDQSFVCKNEQELRDTYSKLKVDKILVQEYIKKKNELPVDGISIDGGSKIFMPYGCHYHHLQEGKYSNYMYFYPFDDEELGEKIRKAIKAVNFSGIFSFEVLLGEDGEYYFLELNCRNSGWSYGFTYGGFNLPFRWAVSTLNNELYLDDFKVHERINVMQEVTDFRERVIDQRVSIFKWLKDVRECDCFLVYNKKDSKPFWRMLRHKLLRF